MRYELPDGLKVWYEYGVTTVTPAGRDITVAVNNELSEPALHRCITAHVVNDQREEVAQGMSVCNEQKDQFCKNIGRDIARGRAAKSLATTEFRNVVA